MPISSSAVMSPWALVRSFSSAGGIFAPQNPQKRLSCSRDSTGRMPGMMGQVIPKSRQEVSKLK